MASQNSPLLHVYIEASHMRIASTTYVSYAWRCNTENIQSHPDSDVNAAGAAGYA